LVKKKGLTQGRSKRVSTKTSAEEGGEGDCSDAALGPKTCAKGGKQLAKWFKTQRKQKVKREEGGVKRKKDYYKKLRLTGEEGKFRAHSHS